MSYADWFRLPSISADFSLRFVVQTMCAAFVDAVVECAMVVFTMDQKRSKGLCVRMWLRKTNINAVFENRQKVVLGIHFLKKKTFTSKK